MKNFVTVTVLVITLGLFYQLSGSKVVASPYPTTDSRNETGLFEKPCWFQTSADWPQVNCYDMQVPESHGSVDQPLITFPVAVFSSAEPVEDLAPVLHLGAGGPGAPMYLDDTPSVDYFWRSHSALSLDLGRNLIVIDPRGTGLSMPLLTCNQFVDSEIKRFQRNLTLIEEQQSVDSDYLKCIAEFLSEGIDLSAYNSFSIAADIETLRLSTKINQWVLIGVSYGATYAQVIANEYPDSIESMILDSASIPLVKFHENYQELVLGPYYKLYLYCDYDPGCTNPIRNTEQRIWKLYESLNKKPLFIDFEFEIGEEKIPILINGKRFLDAVFQGIYGVQIFKDLPNIITELETGQTDSLLPYLWIYVDYMLDRSYGDVSYMTHFCYEEKPFIDFDKVRQQIESLPVGIIQDQARLLFEWPDYCGSMKITETANKVIPTDNIETPTLFLHGRYDTVTPLSSIRKVQPLFSQHHLVIFDLSHSILTSSECSMDIAKAFILQPVESKLPFCTDQSNIH